MKIKAVGFLQALDHFYTTKETGKKQFLLVNLDTGEWETYDIDDLRHITRSRHMIYCVKCGTKNPDDAKVCTQCGASLYPGVEPTRKYERRRKKEEECFGLSWVGEIGGIIFGLIIILAGLSGLLGFEFWNIFWPLIVIAFGILVLASSLYGLRRRR